MSVDSEDSLRAALARAQALFDGGLHHEVVPLLAGHLTLLDPATLGPDHQVVDAAMLYARAVEPIPDLEPDDVAWACYAHRAARMLYGPHHPRTVEAADTLVMVLHSRDLDTDAFDLRRQLIQTHLDRGDIAEHLHARMELAAELHDVGQCGDAVRDATSAWQSWIERYGPDDAAGLPLVLHLIGILIACRRIPEARAAALAANHRYDDAAALLATVLSGLDPADAPPEFHLVDAAILYVQVAAPGPDTPSTLPCAGYPYRASRQLHNPDPAQLQAAAKALTDASAPLPGARRGPEFHVARLAVLAPRHSSAYEQPPHTGLQPDQREAACMPAALIPQRTSA